MTDIKLHPCRPPLLPPGRACCFLLVILLLGFWGRARADEAPPQVWLVSTRSAPHCGDLDGTLQTLQYWLLGGDRQWSAADAKAFRATDDAARPTVVFIHGNQTDADEAVEKAWCIYDSIRAQTGRPFRYVIWSWPADRMLRRNREDIRLKAAYSDVESYYLAVWLDHLRPGVKVSLIGHSFGPRIITGALDLLAGGQLVGRSLPESTVAAWAAGKRNPLRAVLLAAALDADWLAAGGCHDSALSLAEQMLITCNGCDRVLRWYPWLYGRGGPPAMGFVGPEGVAEAKNVAVLDMSDTIGKLHDLQCYCASADISLRWPRYTFLDDSPVPSGHAPSGP